LTYYAYTNPYNASRPTAVAYPDMSPAMVSVDPNTLVVTLSGSDYVSTAFDLAGRPVSRTDQRGTTHAYSYDTAGRLSTDAVTAFGGDTDTYIQAVKFTYDTIGRRTAVTSYTDAACTAVANDVAWAYDGDTAGDLGWGGVKTSWQDHAGTAGSGDPSVQYAYADGASGTAAKFVRLSSVTYPGPATPWTVYYNYPSNAGIGDHLSRLDNMADDSGGTTKYAAYTYLGSGTIVQVSRPGSTLTYKGGAGKYPGFDRLGRVVWQKWRGNEPVEGVIDRYFYGYDRGSNRIWRAERQRVLGYSPPNRDRDEGYLYDGLSRLTTAARGTLVAGSPMAAYDGDFTSDGLVNVNDYLKLLAGYSNGGDEWSEGDINGDGAVNNNDYVHFNVVYGNQPTRNVVQSWSWSLEAMGNWAGYNVTTSAGTLNQTRTHDAANELLNFSTTGGANWAAPTYDLAGNMTSGPKPSDEANRIHLKFDAWNKLVKVSADNGGNPGDPMALYVRDGLGRRIAKITPNTTTSGHWDRTDFYYNESWQVLEERKSLNQTDTSSVATSTYIQNLWDIRYIDAMVCRWRDTNSDGTLDETLYYCNDANMNVTALVDTGGNVVERYNYTPYGTVTVYDSAWNVRAGGSAYDNSILYCGYRFDWETGLYDVRNRPLWPNIGRWGQGDPAGADSMNLYQYGVSRPTADTDPSGEKLCAVKNLKFGPNSEFMQLVNILAPGAKLEEAPSDPKYGCCVVAPEAGTTPQANLVSALADPKTPVVTIGLGAAEYDNYNYGLHQIHMSYGALYEMWVMKTDKNFPGGAATFLGQDAAPMGLDKVPPDRREESVVLAHEMIHAYYDVVEHKVAPSMVPEGHIGPYPINRNTVITTVISFPAVKEEELYTVGLENVVPVTEDKVAPWRAPKSLTQARYGSTKGFTENDIRRSMGLRIREAYSVQRNPAVHNYGCGTEIQNAEPKMR
jgi:RHS repeat-associated protein